MKQQFGRTRWVLPSQILKLEYSSVGQADAQDLAMAAVEAGAMLDLTDGALIWGSLLPKKPMKTVVRIGLGIENATDFDHASALMGADILQSLSALGQGSIDLIALRTRRALESFQIDGAIASFEQARDDGLVSSLAITIEGPETAGRLNWQFRDAFDAVVLHAPSEALSALARERRTAVITYDFAANPGEFQLVPVRHRSQICHEPCH